MYVAYDGSDQQKQRKSLIWIFLYTSNDKTYPRSSQYPLTKS